MLHNNTTNFRTVRTSPSLISFLRYYNFGSKTPPSFNMAMRNHIVVVLAAVVLLVVNAHSGEDAHTCIHDQMMQGMRDSPFAHPPTRQLYANDPVLTINTSRTDRHTQATTYSPIRITLDTTRVDVNGYVIFTNYRSNACAATIKTRVIPMWSCWLHGIGLLYTAPTTYRALQHELLFCVQGSRVCVLQRW